MWSIVREGFKPSLTVRQPQKNDNETVIDRLFLYVPVNAIFTIFFAKTSPIFWSFAQSVLSLQPEKMKKWKGIWKSEKSNLIF